MKQYTDAEWTIAREAARLELCKPERELIAALVEALKWCANHLALIAERDYPGVERNARMFNSERNALIAIRKAEAPKPETFPSEPE